MFSIKGTLKVVFNEVQVSEKFRKREFVIEDNASQYPQVISFILTQDRSDLVNSFNEGDEINVHFNVRGREWKSPQGEVKYFNSLEAWKIELVSVAQPRPQNNNSQTRPPQQNHNTTSSGSEPDDLPF